MSSLVKIFERLRKGQGPAPVDEGRPERRSRPRIPVEEQAVLHWVGPGEEFLSESVEVLDRSPNGMRIRLSRCLPVGLIVWIKPQDTETAIKCVVRHCAEDGGGYVAGVVLVLIERRRFDRRPYLEPGKLHWAGANFQPMTSPVTLRDVSEEGFQLEAPAKGPAPTAVRLSFGGWECMGTTCYCVPNGDKYLVGLQLIGEPYACTPI